jgi:hypothetical protein
MWLLREIWDLLDQLYGLFEMLIGALQAYQRIKSGPYVAPEV